ncbi:carbon-nitrogen hydrolase [Algiphilus aromaticivorans]|uniref:carbon-nitrogen hydrolase n=1 Tax=Algiphilus aromaticivorans TaxID=382454 RepID=UPI0005C136D9|nr:carbon-nitrogen hydrolase [Algiphilus aromaticivorans]
MTATDTLSIAVVQHACEPDRATNLDRSIAGIREAAKRGAQLVLLPELHCSRYFCQQEDADCFDLAEAIPGPGTEAIGAVAAELGVVVVASLFEKRAPGLYHNTAVVLDADGRLAGRYRKMHIPDDPGYYEKFYFTPGDLGFEPIDTAVGRLGVLVCWDQWYPEAARLMALAGAEILLYPTAIGWNPDDAPEEQQRQREAWRTIQRAHAVANGLPVAVANRCGFEPDPAGQHAGADFWGDSFIAGPQGEILTEAGAKTGVHLAEIERANTERVRRWWPFLRDRRIDAYGDLVKRWRD